MALLASGIRNITGARSHVLHYQLRITVTITCGIQAVECGTAVYMYSVGWRDTRPFLPRHTIAYRCIPR